MKKFSIILLAIYSIAVFSYESVPQARPGIYGTLKNVECPIVVVPGKRIGSIELGQNIKEIENLGMEIKSVNGSSSLLIVGRYSVSLTPQGYIRLIEAEIGDLPNCLRYENQNLKKVITSKQLSHLFKGCKKEEVLFGGNSTKCEGISIGTGGWGGTQKTPSLKIEAI